MTVRGGRAAVIAMLLGLAAPGLAQPRQAAGRPQPAVRAAPETANITVAPGEVLHVESTGTGRPVVVVPGLFGTAFGFRKVIGPIADAGHRVIVIEPLGIGASSRPARADYSLEAQARRMAAALDSLGVSNATFLAHSVGGSTTFRLALLRPSLVQGIVSIEGGVVETAGTPGLRRALKLAGVLGRIGLGGIVRGKIRGRFRDSSGDPSWVTDETMTGYMAPLKDDYKRAIGAYRAMASAPVVDSLAPRLAAIRCPVVLLTGAAPHDGTIQPHEIVLMRERLPALTVVDVAGAGHYIHEERPASVVEAVLRLAQ